MLKVSFGNLKQSADYNFRLEFLILPSSGQLKATKRPRLAMEMDKERLASLEKMVATTQLRLAMETEEERVQKKDCF